MFTLSDKSYSRIVIVQILYGLNLSSAEIKDLTEESIKKDILHLQNFHEVADLEDFDKIKAKAKPQFINAILMALSQNIDVIDEIIIKNLVQKDSWARMNILIQAVLRSAIAEYLYLNTARKVLIDEYVNITGSFFTVKETNFVNATLDKITKTLESNTKAT